MKTMKLPDGCWIAVDGVAEVVPDFEAGTITVRMKNGIGHTIEPEQGVTISETVKRLIAEIDEPEDIIRRDIA
jgi:hypothetical protein